jgi:hypothetical protein
MIRPPDKLLLSCHCSSSRIFERQKNLPIEFHTWCKHVKLYASHLHLIQEGGIANLVQDPDRGSDSRHSQFLFWVHDFLPGESEDVLFVNTTRFQYMHCATLNLVQLSVCTYSPRQLECIGCRGELLVVDISDQSHTWFQQWLQNKN